LFTLPSSNSKVYLVYVDTSNGAICIDSSGTEAVSPVAPDYKGKLVLAEVTLASTDTDITASKIKDVRPFLTSERRGVDGVTITVDSNGDLAVKDQGIAYGKIKDKWDSGWFFVTKDTIYTKTHNLGSQALMFQQYFAPDSGGAPDLSDVTPVVGHNDANVDWRYFNLVSGYMYQVTNTQLKLQTGYEKVACIPPRTGGAIRSYISGWYRIIAMRLF